jgi:hypothetical protein
VYFHTQKSDVRILPRVPGSVKVGADTEHRPRAREQLRKGVTLWTDDFAGRERCIERVETRARGAENDRTGAERDAELVFRELESVVDREIFGLDAKQKTDLVTAEEQQWSECDVKHSTSSLT